MSIIGYKSGSKAEALQQLVSTEKSSPERQYEVAKADQNSITEACQRVFDSVVSREYLHELHSRHVIPLSNSSLRYPKVRWYKVDKIIMEKDVFFTDKLSMLYMSLHNSARNVILVLNKEKDGDIELYLGARDFTGNSCISGEVLEAGLQGYFPGVGFRISKVSPISFNTPAISAVSAIASLRDDKKEEFVQGVERLINATESIPRFRAYFIADSVKNEEVGEMIAAFNNLYTSLSPAETLQMTFSQSVTDGVSNSFTKNFTESIGESISKTVTHTDGYSETLTESDTETEGTSENHSRNIIASIYRGLVGGKTGSGKNQSRSNSHSQAIGKNFSNSEANQTGNSTNVSTGTSDQTGTNKSNTEGTTKQITYKNRTAKYYLDILDKQLERLQNGRPFGLWSVATYFVANDPTTAQQLSSIYRGCIIGEESGLETCAINTWVDKTRVNELCNYLNNSLHPRFDFNSLNVSAGSVVNSKELAIHLSFPQSSVPGIVVEERAVFARNVHQKKMDEEQIKLGTVSHLGKVYTTSVGLNLSELTKHTFVTGSTGSGKSNTMYLLLQQLREKKKTFLVIEPAKGEYKHVFGCLPDVTVYSNTNKVGNLLKINPFVFPCNTIDVLEHIDRLVEIFNACWPMYAAMPAVLKHSIIEAYEQCGWDVNLSEHKLKAPVFPKIEDVIVCLKSYLDKSEYSEETKSDYKGALEVRLQDLCDGMFGRMLNADNIEDEEIFNKNVIVDLSRIGSTETKSLIMGFLIMKLNEFRMSEGGMNRPLRHVTVLEEAHNLLKRTSTAQGHESSNLAGKSVEMIANSIAEMRTYGEAFIIVDQSPSMLDPSAIRNTNTKVILALPDVDDRKAAGAAMSLDEEQIEEISKQKQGEAIVYQNVWEAPVQCKIDRFVEYDVQFEFKEKSKDDSVRQRTYHADIVRFLLAPYIKHPFDGNELRTVVESESMPNSLRYKLLSLLEEYCKTRELSLWAETKFVDLTLLVRSYLNMDKEYQIFTSQYSDMRQVRVKLDELILERLGVSDRATLYYVEMCYVRNNALYNDWRNTFK